MQESPREGRLLTVKEFAKTVGVSPSTVYRLLRTGGVPATRSSGVWQIPEEAIGDFPTDATGPATEEARRGSSPSLTETLRLASSGGPLEISSPDRHPTPDNAYARLLDEQLSSEDLIRQGLRRIETDLRRMILGALDDWDDLGWSDPRLGPVVAALRRASWDAMNQLMTRLEEVIMGRLEAADQQVADLRSPRLRAALRVWRRPIGPGVARTLAPLAEFTRVEWRGDEATYARLFSLAFCLHYRMLQEAPTDVRWWIWAGNALAPLIELLAREDVFRGPDDEAMYSLPWFCKADGELWSYYGVSRKNAVKYVAPDGRVRREFEPIEEAVETFERLLGCQLEHDEPTLHRALGRRSRRDFIGVVIGDFIVERVVGESRYGTIHVGRQLSLGRRVAVKIAREDLTGAQKHEFLQAASALDDVDSPSVVTVCGFGEEAWFAPRTCEIDKGWFGVFRGGPAKRCFAAFDWVVGRTLQEILEETERPEAAEVAGWFLQAAEGLAAIHEAGRLHLNINSRNIVITHAGRAKILDIGLRPTEDDPCLAPELIDRDVAVDGRPSADVYALARSFLGLLTGRDSPEELAAAKGESIESVLGTALETDVALRFQDGPALLASLRELLGSEVDVPGPVEKPAEAS